MIIRSLRPATGVPALRQRYDKEEHERAAYHEGGHATVARLLGFRCGDVIVKGNGAGSSTIMGFDYSPTLRPVVTFMRGAADMSGPESEVHFCGSAHGCQADKDNIRIALDKLGQPDDVDELFAAMNRKAEDMVQRHEAKIEKIAYALMKQGELSDSEVRRLMG